MSVARAREARLEPGHRCLPIPAYRTAEFDAQRVELNAGGLDTPENILDRT